jgi:NitT/TauT family transport system permease protein
MSTADTGTGVQVEKQEDKKKIGAERKPGSPRASSQLPRSGRRAPGLSSRVGLPLLVAGVIIGLWYLVSEFALNSYQRFMLPPPHQVIETGFLTWSNFTALVGALRWTAEVTFIGLAISIVLGVGTATLMSQAKWVENALYPWAVVLQTVPILALTPMLSFFFGFALTPRIIVAVIIAFFPIVSNTLFGLKSADQSMHDLFTLHKAGRWTRLVKLQFPAALPAMFNGFRVSAGLAVIGAIVGEFFFKQGQAGLGTNMSVYTSLTEGQELWANVLTACLLGIAVFVFFGWLSRRVVGRWYLPSSR